MAFWAKRRINNDTSEWCRPGGVRILETIHDMAEAACDGTNGLGVPWDGIHAWTRQTSTVWKKIAPVYSGVTDNRSCVAEGNFCHTLVLPVKICGKRKGDKQMKPYLKAEEIRKDIREQLPVIDEETFREHYCSECMYYAGRINKKARCMEKMWFWYFRRRAERTKLYVYWNFRRRRAVSVKYSFQNQ